MNDSITQIDINYDKIYDDMIYIGMVTKGAITIDHVVRMQLRKYTRFMNKIMDFWEKLYTDKDK